MTFFYPKKRFLTIVKNGQEMEELVCKTCSTKIEKKSIKTYDREKENIQMLSHCIKLYFSIKIMIKHEKAII